MYFKHLLLYHDLLCGEQLFALLIKYSSENITIRKISQLFTLKPREKVLKETRFGVFSKTDVGKRDLKGEYRR